MLSLVCVYSCIYDIPSKVEHIPCPYYKQSKAYTKGGEMEAPLLFSMSFNFNIIASQGHRCNGNLFKYGRKKM